MYRYQRLLVGLAGTDRDATTIKYAALVSRMAKSEKIYFVHVASRLEIPESIRNAYPGLLEPIDEQLTEEMRARVGDHFPRRQETSFAFNVVEGIPVVEILRLARQKEIDLILVGKTEEHQESGMLPEKLARKAPCSVLVVPENANPRISKILVPVDFSEHSADAMDVAIAFSSAGTFPSIVCVHVYRIFQRYVGSEVSYKQFAEKVREDVEDTYQAFIQNIDMRSCSATPLFSLSRHPSRAIAKAVKEQKADLVSIGARGRTAAAALILGSVTERLIASTEIPLIAVKKKGTGLSLLDALFPP